MVLALLAGTKTQTRRVMKPQPFDGPLGWMWDGAAYIHWSLSNINPADAAHCCPYGQPGDRLWVRETWRPWNDVSELWDCVQYRSDGAMMKPRDLDRNQGGQFSEECDATITDQVDGRDTPWRPSIFMPRWASRITLEVTDVRVQRVQEISEEDAKAEGIDRDKWGVEFYAPGVVYTNCYGDKLPGVKPYHKAADAYRDLWDKINGKRGFGWDENPWVWAITFRRVGNG
jgi:hypothetical protein